MRRDWTSLHNKEQSGVGRVALLRGVWLGEGCRSGDRPGATSMFEGCSWPDRKGAGSQIGRTIWQGGGRQRVMSGI